MPALIFDFIPISSAYRRDSHGQHNWTRSRASILVFAVLGAFCSAIPMLHAQNLYTGPAGASAVMGLANWQIQRGSTESSFQLLASTAAGPQARSEARPDSSTPAKSGPGIYRDPYGRYSLTVPDGWTAEPQTGSGALQLSSGPSWAMFVTGGGSVPRDVSHQITQQIQAQFTGFQLLNEGDLQINGHASHGITATGVNPKGARVSVLVLSINVGSGHFLSMISSAPIDQARTVNGTIMQIAQSIRFGGK